jgi:alkane 1-monooxygenase
MNRRLKLRVPHPKSWCVVAGSYFAYALFPLFLIGLYLRGNGLALPACFVLVIVPALDSLAGESCDEFARLDMRTLQLWLLSFAPIGFVTANTLVIWVAAAAFTQLTTFEKCLVGFSVGIIGSIGITAAHELIHKSGGVQKFFGRLGLLNVFYPHFEINHIESHHVWMCTDHDQSTAPRGESLYHFVARTIPGCLSVSWSLEIRRLRHRGHSVLSLRNRMLRYLIVQLAYLAALTAVAGGFGLMLFFFQAGVAVFMLESVSYIEHYGLRRGRMDNGRYAPMTPTHSWDSYHRFSNYLEFHLQRHADHHTAPAKSHYVLQRRIGALRLPAGYPVMIGLAMIPPLWRYVMHGRLPVSPCGL